MEAHQSITGTSAHTHTHTHTYTINPFSRDPLTHTHTKTHTQERLTHLTTQLNWRLNESTQGEAIYLLGVRDDGYPYGISEDDFRASIHTLTHMAKNIHAKIHTVKTLKGVHGKIAQVFLKREAIDIHTQAHIHTPTSGSGGGGGAPHSHRGGVNKHTHTHTHTQPPHLRIAVLGRVSSGKSTLVGVLTKGKLDNGRGLARMQVCVFVSVCVCVYIYV